MTPFIYPIPGGAGAPGFETLFGAGVPAGALGNVGDSYFDTTNKNVYKKTGPVTWTIQTSYALAVKDEGTLLDSVVDEINFTGSDVLAESIGTGKVKISIPTPPPPPFGIFTGGTNIGASVYYKRTDKLDFANDTLGMVAQPDLATARGGISGHHSSLAGYVSGGENTGDLLTEKFTFAALTWGLAGSLSTGNRAAYGAYNSTTRGYISGGKLTGVETNITESLDYSSDLAAMTAKGSLIASRQYCASCQSSVKGYTAGGSTSVGGYHALNSCEALTFATDGAAMVTVGSMGASRDFLAAFNSSSRGYFCGGENGSTPYQMQIYALTFASDGSAMVNKGALVNPARGGMAGANSTTYGYIAGGNESLAVVTTCQAMNFASDTSALLAKGTLTLARIALAGLQSGGIL